MLKRLLAAVLTMAMVISPLSGVTTVLAETEAIPADALELYYDFDDVEGTTVPDKSGNENNGTLLNEPVVVSDTQAQGNVLSLNDEGIYGADAQGISLPAELFAGLDNVTIMMDVRLDHTQSWINFLTAGTNSGNYMVFVNQGFGSSGNFGLSNATNYNRAGEKRIAATTDTKLPVGSWARAAFTQAADGTAKLYIDNVLVAEGELDHLKDIMSVEGSQIRIGNNYIYSDLGLQGRLDNVRVYSTVLTAEQMETISWDINTDGVGDVYFEELGKNGLVAEYFTFDTEALEYVDSQGCYIESKIESSDMETVLLARAGSANAVGAVWTGRIAAPEDGNYNFYAYCDNGIRVYLDGELIIDWWVNQWDKEQTSASIPMKKGEAHDIRVEWFEVSGGSHITLRWKNDQTLTKRVIPASAYYLPEEAIYPLVDEIDASAAVLDRNKDNFGGTLTLNGANLSDVTEVEYVYSSGSTLATPAYGEIVSAADGKLVVEVPEALRGGTYSLKLTKGDISLTTSQTITVIAANGEADRMEHPRPDWSRADWINLNGWWEFTFDEAEVGLSEGWYDGTKTFDQQINVPYPWESEMSGINNASYKGQAWYQRELNLDETWFEDGKTVHLYFGAVDAKCIVYVNGQEVGSHNGGYTQFEFDITDYVSAGSNTLTLWVEDKGNYGDDSYPALVGKQGHNAPCGYTHTGGIWQTVYVESRTETYLNHAYANPDVEAGSVTYDIEVESTAAQKLQVTYSFESKLWDESLGKDVATGSSFFGSQQIEVGAGISDITLEPIVIDNVKLWSDTDPHLYYGTINIQTEDGQILDSVSTYFGMREVYTENYADRDYEYIFVNGKPVFLAGLLDQGFWSEGIYTAPDEEALKYDILAMKELGFNMIRKHLKIEDPLQYYWCDKLGMYVMADMPHATDMNASVAGEEAEGRPIYEEALRDMLKRDYNHPSVIVTVLFNETWGINHNAAEASDGMTTHEWMEYLYYVVKEINPGMIVEDMSACNQDHIQPTDINTFHMYPNGYADTKSVVTAFVSQQYEGSGKNFWGDYKQEQEPLMNSEYGGVGAFDGDYDVSLCFKFMTDLQRMAESMNGYVYTEPYDIEWERNGLLTYDRRDKLFPYDEVAYGGDMTMVDLNQADYVGIDVEPAAKVEPSSAYSATAVAVNWSGNEYEDIVLKWRFDATDVYGNAITTDLDGKFYIEYPAYTAEEVEIKFVVPDEECVGTLTVWLESNGEKIAKNFVNVIVTGTPETVESIDEDTVALRDASGPLEVAGTGALTYEYAVPEGFDVNDLSSLRMIVEASSMKEATTNHGITNSAYSQTTEGSERPSDMTVTINGIEIDTVYLPDNPRDIRGTLTFDEGHSGGDSAGNFGYLVNINVPKAQMAAVQEAIAADGKIVVSYAVKEDAANKNGLRIYDHETGRYAVNPTVVLNPNDLTADAAGEVTPNGENYLVSAILSDGNSISLRGGIAVVSLDNGVLTLGDEAAQVGEGDHMVSVRVFDDHYQVYTDNNPVPVIDLYDYTEVTSAKVASDGTDIVVSPDKDAKADTGIVDKSELEEVVAEANGRKKGNYTSTTWKTFAEALATAKSVLADENATQKEVDAAKKELVNASAYLEKVLSLVASYDMSYADGKLIDTTGNGYDAALVNIDENDFSKDGEDQILTMTGVDNQYVELPAGMIEEELFAIEMTLKTSTRANYYAWCLGTKETGAADNHVFMGPKSGISASGVTGPIRAGIKFSGAEQLLGSGYAGVIQDDVFTTIRMEFEKGDIMLYVDGVETSSMESGVSIQDILAIAEKDTPGVCGYIGKSLWEADRDFTGSVTQFNVYATADDEDFIAPAADKEALQAAVDAEKEAALVKEEYTEETWNAYAEALANAEAILVQEDALQEDVDAAVTALADAKAGLEEAIVTPPPVDKGENIALTATASGSYVSSWMSLQYAGINDGIDTIPAGENGNSYAWATWGNTTDSEYIQYNWDTVVEITGADLYIWDDNPNDLYTGVDTPASLVYEYLPDGSSEWVELVTVTEGIIGGAAGELNEVTFETPEKAAALRVTLNKNLQEGVTEAQEGVGATEWKVYGKDTGVAVTIPVDKFALAAAVAAEKEAALAADDYTEDTWKAYAEALAAAEALVEDADATQEEVDAAVAALAEAKAGLEPAAVPVDKTALQEAVDAAEAKKAEEYTEKTWEAYQAVLADAKEVLADEDATQTAVDEAAETLVAAAELLRFVLPYEDVAETDWFYESVYYNYFAKTMTGMDDTHFGPYESLSRAQFALILYRIEGEPEVQTEKSFLDISGEEWYGQAVLWAAEAGIVTGYENGCYGPVDMITREQMAVMMYRYAKYLEKDVTKAGDISEFLDVDSVSPFAAEAMSWANGMGIITGKENGTMLAPQANTARAEAAAIIERYMTAYAE